jgi:hypothetical protein
VIERSGLNRSTPPQDSAPSVDAGGIRTVQLFSATGRLINEYLASEMNGKLNVAQLAPGAYFLKVFGPNKWSQGAFMKE